MTIFLPVFMFFITAFSYQKNAGIREGMVKSYIVLFFLVAISTEVFSILGAVSHHMISLFWIAATLFSFLFYLFLLKRHNFSALIKDSLALVSNNSGQEHFFLVLVGVILATTLLVAVLAPPNNWDSMTYHMSRVAEWIQRENVDYFPTSIDRQNYQMPLAEFAILHVQILSSSDRFANIVQWYSLCVSILFVTLIAKEFQVPRQAQLFSAVVAATIPMAILQSSSTQNDLVVAAFCLGFAYFLLRLVRTLSFQDAIFCALALGLALLTKGTAYLYCCAIGLTVGTVSLLSSRVREMRWTLFSKLAIVAVAGLAINVGPLSRNYAVYGQPLPNILGYMNEEFSSAVLFSNIVRNAALHVGMPSDHFGQVNWYTLRLVQLLLGDQLNNPRSTFPKTRFSIPSSLHEDLAGNFLHFFLIIFVFLSLPLVKISTKGIISGYSVSIILGAVLYCSVLRWQPWASRLHTPIFMLSAPLIAVVLMGFQSFYKRLFVYLAILFFVYSSPFLLLNSTRPLITTSRFSPGPSLFTTDRLKQYFAARPDLYEDYVAAVKIAIDTGEENVGLYLGRDDFEYPLWVLMNRHAGKETAAKGPRFRHVGVRDISKKKEKQNMPAPALVLATSNADGNIIGDKEYDVIFQSKHIRVLKLKATSQWHARPRQYASVLPLTSLGTLMP